MFVERVKFIIAVVIYGTIGAIYHSNRNVLYQKNSWETSVYIIIEVCLSCC